MKKQITVSQPSREEIFREKARTYLPCFTEHCPLMDHCLHALVTPYIPQDRFVTNSINLQHPQAQTTECAMYRSDEVRRMPVGLTWLYHDMPGWQERVIKGNLMRRLTHTGYYRYRNGSRPITPDVEAYIRQLLKGHGITQEPHFDGYVEDYVW